MNRKEIEDEAAPHQRKTDWTRIAAWTFGAWAIMVPLAASIIVSGQNKILSEIQSYRLESMAKDSSQDSTIATLTAYQVMVLMWKARLEAAEEKR